MALTLILGPASSGKEQMLLDAYRLAARRGALLVVPSEDEAARYERELAHRTPGGVTLGHALTFPALLEEIAERAGCACTQLTALQRECAMRRALARLPLELLAGVARTPGFARAACRLVAELRGTRVGAKRFADALRRWAQGETAHAVYARELAAIYAAFEQELDRAGVPGPGERSVWDALDVLREQPDRWRGTAVFVHGFGDFSALELDAIETLARPVGAQVTVTVTYEPGRAALAARATIVEELRARATRVTELDAGAGHLAPAARSALGHLERHLFDSDPARVAADDSVMLLEAGGRRAEAELIAAEVLQALDEGVPAMEIVVVCRSLTQSGALLEDTLRRYGVPAHSRRRVPLAHTPLGRALLALVRCAIAAPEAVDLDDLIVCLRASGLRADLDAVDRLEAQMRRAGTKLADLATLQGRRAAQPALEWIAKLRGADDAGGPASTLGELTRMLLLGPHAVHAARVLDRFAALDARAASAVLEGLTQLAELGVARREPERTQRRGRHAALDELLALLNALEVPADGDPARGEVLVTEPGALGLRRFRRVFVSGLCDGEFPAAQAGREAPFLDDSRRRELALASGLALPLRPDPAARERALLYESVACASERVTLSYRSSDEDGNLVVPSPFLADIAALFTPEWRRPRRRRLLSDVAWPLEQAPTERERALALALRAGVESAASDPARCAPATAPHAPEPAPGSPGAAPRSSATVTLGADAIPELRHARIASASALELFCACPVKWLIERQLHCESLEPDPDPLTRGSLMHTLLERVIGALEGPLRPSTLPLAERALEDAIAHTDTALASGQPAALRAAILAGIEADLRRYLRYEASAENKWPAQNLELHFGTDGSDLPALVLSDGQHQTLLRGVIDRLDVEPGADGRGVDVEPGADGGGLDVEPGTDMRATVRDYKSGTRKDAWRCARWLAEGQLQVGLYMIAVRRLLGLRPVAGLYQPLSGDDLRPRGAFTDRACPDPHAVGSDRLDADELDALLERVEQEAVRIGAELQAGRLTPCPATCSPGGGCAHPGLCWAA